MGSGLRVIRVWLLTAIPFAFLNIGQAIATPASDTVKIGLLIRTSSNTSAVEGAMLAATEANRKANGKRTVKIIVKSMEGPWGTGSKMAVDLIFNDKVAAIIGAVDGRNGHLVEQACTKTQVVMLSVFATDPTLSQAFVPWFYNCIPNDKQQAAALAEEIFLKQKLKNIVVIYDKAYDSGFSLKYFRMKTGEMGKGIRELAVISDEKTENDRIASKAAADGTDGVVLFCSAERTAELAAAITSRKPSLRIFTSSHAADDDAAGTEIMGALMKKSYLTTSLFNMPEFELFRASYKAAYRKDPGLFAAYTYDATSLLIRAIDEAGDEREKIQPWIYKTSFKGVTGTFGFDKMGNRNGILQVIRPGLHPAFSTDKKN